MTKKTSQRKPSVDFNNTENLIKSLGGAQEIYKYLLSKNKKITIESIYKWKKNGIPHRYRTEIKELSSNNGIKLADESFLDENGFQNNNTKIVSNKTKKNILSYLLIIIFIFLLVYVFYNNKKIYTFEQKILSLEKIISSESVSNFNKEINALKKINTEQNNLVQTNALRIDDLYVTNKKITGLIDKIEPELSNFLLNQNQNINSDNLNSIYILLYLIDLKNNIKFFSPNLKQFNLISSYFSKTSIPERAEIALSNINKLSNSKIKSHKNIIDEFDKILLIKDNEASDKTDVKNTILNKFKKLVKVSKINSNTDFHHSNFRSKIINSLNNYNYQQSIYELNNINNEDKFNETIKDINNLKILYESINTIIKWLIFKG